ncbi:rho GTPase-activating protein 22 isoform X1 [Osmerus eperlanus]|uniref:rho GTPase-activating protein 22 isoform X1 n=2 Tax=Osmerus eperlanus TaxID=29151 RepID=UPI002E12A63F
MCECAAQWVLHQSKAERWASMGDDVTDGFRVEMKPARCRAPWPTETQRRLSARSKSMVMGELSRISRPCSPPDQQRALKAGWLKRQRSIMKNWQLRWFVLSSQALFFYKDQEEAKAQGCIPLQGSQVNEIPANQDEPGRHLFEIIPGGAGEKDRSGLSHESFLLMANSHSDMEDWVRAIRRAIWTTLGGGVFGQHLEETMLCEAQCSPQRRVPVLVEQCVCFIFQQGLGEEGLFRAPGQTNLVRELQDAFDRGEKPLFDSSTDVHTVASLLKLYLRELPEPVIPFTKYTQFLSCAQLLTKDYEMGIQELVKQVKALPQVNYNLLKYICKFLDEVQTHSSENKMSVQNLATVFGPNILRPRVEDPVTMMEGSSQIQHLMTLLISQHSRLYEREGPEDETKTPTPPPQAPGQRAMVGWVSHEEVRAPSPSSESSSRPLKEALQPAPSTPSLDAKAPEPASSGQAEVPAEDLQAEGREKTKAEGKIVRRADGKSEGKSEGGASLSPSKQSKPVPSWRCSLKGGAGATLGVGKGKMGGSAGDMSSVATGNWLMNGLSSLRSHRRTASSGERLKDSSLCLKDSTLSLKEVSHSLKDSQQHSLEDSPCSHVKPSQSHKNSAHSHRLSAYDNVTATPSSLSVPVESSNSSTWTSCEISLAESTGSDRVTQGPESGQGQSWRSEAGDSSEVLDQSVSSAGCGRSDPEDDLSRGQGSGVNESLTSLVSELKQELKRQRIAYETRIRKLEEGFSVAQDQMSRLEEDLDQEKKRFCMLEIRLKNSERARQDAENRNVHLQKEMEEFFTTLGDLTTGAPRTT